MRYFLSILFTLVIHWSFAQSIVTFLVQDSITKTPLAAASIQSVTNGKGSVTADNGMVTFSLAHADTFRISRTGYETEERIVDPSIQKLIMVSLMPGENKLDEVVVSSFRTNSRIEDLPTRVEVLGQEEVGEENGIKPGNIASLLGDVAGIQIQQTSAATGNADMRVQGLPGKYTQILRDGMPLFGGYSGSFSILQIPPLDLQQIEIVKGASSTLYGGGAIAGMVNLVSKKPSLNKKDRSLTLNHSSLNETNVNAFFSARNKTVGYTTFAGGTLQKATDVNKDGFSDVPGIKSFFVHPRLFLYPKPTTTITVGYTASYEDRNGGDMNAMNNGNKSNGTFFIQNKSVRNTFDVEYDLKANGNGLFVARGSASIINRQVVTNVFGMKARQLSYYSEVSYTNKSDHHNWVAGINVSGDNFRKIAPDSSLIPNSIENTLGLFAQETWKVAQPFTIEAGLRVDHHDTYGNFVLPRLSLMYKFNTHITTRLGGGLGYKTPTLFSAEIDERDYKNLSGFAPGTKAERSSGINWDINFKTKMDDWSFTLNQTFFLTDIQNPLVAEYAVGGPSFQYKNASDNLRTTGFETYIQTTKDPLELYLGYVFTNAKQLYNKQQPYIPLTARNKIASVIAFEWTEEFRTGIEAAYTGAQHLENGKITRGYLFGAAMARYDIGKVSIVLNCENLFDFRQNKHEQVVFPPYNNPSFPEIWAPLDGRVINLSMCIKW